MPVDFEWEVGEEDGEWSTLATPRARRRRRPPRWVWYALLALLLVGGGGTYFVIHQRYERARERLIFEIQSVLDLQARAYAEDDQERFIAQIDRDTSWWYGQERHRLSDACRQEVPPSPECASFLPGSVEDVEVRGEFALALVAEEGGARRARFYRRVGAGWLYTAPRREFWDTTAETDYNGLRVRAHRRDLPYIDPLLDRIAASYEQVCAPVGCHAEPLTVAFVVSLPTERMPRLEEDTLLVDSPWLVGIPALENLDADYLLELDASAWWASLEGVFALSPGDEPNPVQRALMSEYMAWTREGHLDRSPLLRRLIERRGIGALPQIIRSLLNNPSPEALGQAWLALPPGADEVLFQFLLDVEYEALLAGQFETVALFYDLGPDLNLEALGVTGYQDLSNTLQDLPAPVVVSAEVSRGQARVMLASDPGAPTDLPPAEFYVRREGRWLHTMPYYLLDYARARSAPPRAPDQVTIRFACDRDDQESYERLADAFSGEHPGIAVEILSLPELTGVAEDGGDGLTYRVLSQCDATIAPLSGVRPEWVRDLAPSIAADPDFHPEDVIGLEADGEVWGIPMSLTPLMIHYDRDAFDAAGVPYPRPGWTADEFLSTARSLTLRREEEVSRYGFISLYLGDMPWLQGRVCAGEEDLTVPAVRDAVRWYVDLSLVHGVMLGLQDLDPPAPDIETFWHRAQTLIEQGHAAMWAYAVPGWDSIGSEANYGLVPYPELGCAANPVYVGGYVMSDGTRHPVETWQWLSYLSLQPVPGQLELGRSTSIPARWSLLADYARWQEWDEEDLSIVRYALEHMAPLDDVLSPLREALVSILFRGWGIDSALARAQEEAESGLAGQ